MARVTCRIQEVDLEGDYTDVPGVEAECTECGHTTESYGTSGASVRRCLVLMREECPRSQQNFYVAEEWDDLDEVWG